jgi:hypothetical protein
MDTPVRVKYATDHDRFWAKVDKSGACWIWQASKNYEGYGKFNFHGKPRRAHRISYLWAYGDLPDDAEVDHACHQRACVNPAHLRAVTSSGNSQNLKGAYSNSKSGVRGVSWFRDRSVWKAEAALEGKRYFLGYYTDLREAEKVVVEWRRANMPYSEMDKKKAA